MTVATGRLRALVVRLPSVSWRAAALAFAATLLAGPLIAAASAMGIAAVHDGRALPGVSVAGVDVSGLDRSEAEALIRQELPSLSSGSITLAVGDERRAITFASFGRDYAIDAMLRDALAIGRSGTILDSTLTTLRSIVHGSSVPASVTYDEAALERLVYDAAISLVRQPAEASVELAESGRFEVIAGQSGREIDLDAALAAASAIAGSLSEADATVELGTVDVTPTVTTAEASRVAEEANAIAGRDLALRVDDEEFVIAARDVAGWLDVGPTSDGRYAVSLVTERVRAALEALAPEVNRAPVDAGYAVQGAGVVVTPSVTGRALDVEATLARVSAMLEELRAGGASLPAEVELAVTETQPSLTTEEAQAALPQVTVIGTWTTYFTPNVGDFWGENIAVPTRILDGYVVAPGAWFEFWSAVGPVTPERGYGPGGAIINGRSVPTGALAGGICSTSTTLFNAALRAGLEIGARTNHYYYIPRYPTGLDATVAIADGAVTTMSFRNDTPYPIIIRGYYEYGVVRFDLVSVPTGRSVSFSEPVTWNHRAARDEIEYTDDLAPGVQERIEYPHDGFEVNVTRTVTDASGAVIHQETYYSNYGVVNGIIREGAPAEEDAEEADASASPPASASPSPTPTP